MKSPEASINQPAYTNYCRSNLNNFVTSTSKVLFQKLKLPSGFLQKDLDTWNDDNDFLRAASIVPELKVVNDHAERGVILVQEYYGLKNKQQLQVLLRIVQKHRKKSPGGRKITLKAIIAQNWNLKYC